MPPSSPLPWSPPALGAAVFIALHYLFLRGASGRVEDRLGALVLETTAALGIALSLVLGVRGASVPTTRLGLALAATSGLAISFASVLMFAALRRGGPVAATGTIVLGGGVVLSAIAAPWLFGETITFRRLVGVCLGLAAMAVLSRE
ncbi:MAG: EamA family transporter [Polyangiaceae bacterium]